MGDDGDYEDQMNQLMTDVNYRTSEAELNQDG